MDIMLAHNSSRNARISDLEDLRAALARLRAAPREAPAQ
jgi:hypothetical protein